MGKFDITIGTTSILWMFYQGFIREKQMLYDSILMMRSKRLFNDSRIIRIEVDGNTVTLKDPLSAKMISAELPKIYCRPHERLPEFVYEPPVQDNLAAMCSVFGA